MVGYAVDVFALSDLTTARDKRTIEEGIRALDC